MIYVICEASSFTALVKSQLEQEVEAAEELMSLAVRYGVRPQQEAFDALIACGDLVHAEKWFARMRKFQVPPSEERSLKNNLKER